MNNWEKYKEDIEKITENSKTTIMCVVNEFSKVCKCKDTNCDECQRKNVEWLTQEAESDHIGEVNEMVEPQQSKARFVKCHEKGGDERIIDIRCIDEIGYNTEECATELVLYDHGRYFIRKPIDEVIQQLGIEVL